MVAANIPNKAKNMKFSSEIITNAIITLTRAPLKTVKNIIKILFNLSAMIPNIGINNAGIKVINEMYKEICIKDTPNTIIILEIKGAKNPASVVITIFKFMK